MDLFEQVLHALEGEEETPQVWHDTDGERVLVLHTFGPDRWIERAHSGRLDAINLLAVILFAVRDGFDLKEERGIVESWANELRAAADSGEIKARNSISLLPLHPVPEGWDWMVSLDDADAFVKARGMGWSCTSIVGHLLDETRKAGESWYDQAGHLAYKQWRRGYEPGHVKRNAVAPESPEETAADREGLAQNAFERRSRAGERAILTVLGLLSAAFADRAGTEKYWKNDGFPNANALAEELASIIECRACDAGQRIEAAGLSVDTMRRAISDGVKSLSERMPMGAKLRPLRVSDD